MHRRSFLKGLMFAPAGVVPLAQTVAGERVPNVEPGSPINIRIAGVLSAEKVQAMIAAGLRGALDQHWKAVPAVMRDNSLRFD